MKNKLSPEEQLLHSKLNENQFTYQESDWAQIESTVAKKSFWANYSPFFKAAVAFVVLGAAVYLVNQRYQPSAEATVQPTEKKQLEQPKKTEIEKLSTPEPDETSEPLTNKSASTSSVETTSPNQSATGKAATNLIKQPAQTDLRESSTPVMSNSETKEPTTSTLPTIDITEIKILNAPCLNETLHAKIDVKSDLTKNSFVEWKLNGRTLKFEGTTVNVELKQPGDYLLEAAIYQEQKRISDKSINFKVENKVNLDFSYENLSTPFNDKRVKLTVSDPQEGTYTWFENKRTKESPQGKEIEWGFNTEGTRNITLEYTSAMGCVQQHTKEVEMDIFFTPLVFPNAFTPYNGGNNDVFELNVLKQHSYTSYELIIQDINGNTVYKSINVQDNWNGRLNNTGETLRGKFSWAVKLQNNQGETTTFQGKVQIL